jgi:hypothetical protein
MSWSIRSAPLPDLLVLRQMDEDDVVLMRTRIAQGRARIPLLDPSTVSYTEKRSAGGNNNVSWNWHTTQRHHCGLHQADDGWRLSFGATSVLRQFSFADDLLPRDAIEREADAGIDAAIAMLDRFEALLETARIRNEGLDRSLSRGAPSPDLIPPRAAAQAAAWQSIAARYAALARTWGSDGAADLALKLDPPSPTSPGRLVDLFGGHSVVTSKGLEAVMAGIPTVADLADEAVNGYRLLEHGPVQHIEMPQGPDAVSVLRLLFDIGVDGNGARLLAPRLRRG